MRKPNSSCILNLMLPQAFAVAAWCLSITPAAAWAESSPPGSVKIAINSRKSLVHMGSVDSTMLTQDGTKAAKLALEYFETGRTESAREALVIYDQIIPKENYGGDYTAVQWLLEYKLASPEKKAQMVDDVPSEAFAEFFTHDDYSQTKEYLRRKYKIGKLEDGETTGGIKRRAFLEDYMNFNNPRRESWEHTTEMLQAVDVKPGMQIADVGSGPGYFTFRFAKIVGDKGRVYAIDTVADHNSTVAATAAKKKINNVVTVLGPEDHTIGLGSDQVDMVWLCSLYHIIYITYVNQARDSFIESIKRAMKKDATLYVVDNGIVPDGVLPYHGPYIDRELLIGQFQEYGFRLTNQFQVIPQRYVLVFKKA